MLTRCPHCQTVFALRAGHLAVASGWVRCPDCGRGFNALEHLFDSWEDALAPDERRHEVLALCNIRPLAPGWALVAPGVPRRMPGSSTGAAAADAEGADAAAPATVEVPAVLLEDFQAPRPRTGLRLLQGGLLLLLLFVLLGQGVYLQRERLYSLAGWQPRLERFCALAGCALPLRRAPTQWSIQAREVRAHPRLDGALEVKLDLVNQAGFTQAYPLVGIFFTDLTGRQQAGRWFRPADYLPPSRQAGMGVPADARLQLRLTLRDPGAELASYQFDFR